ncbi:MAG: chemotaxis protein CheA [Actinobacteria bacterium]|nr:chemotaxis protein CheA [Actinomycetota bacterium]
MSVDMSAYLDIFNTEATELLASLNNALLALERNGVDAVQINETFRVAHTLKGMAATMGFNKMAELTHGMEALLEKVRKGQRTINSELLDLLFNCLDALSVLLKTGELESLEELKAALDAASTGHCPSESGYEVSVKFLKSCAMPKARSHVVIKALEKIATVESSNMEELSKGTLPDSFKVTIRSTADRATIESVLLSVSEVEAASVTRFKDKKKPVGKKAVGEVDESTRQPGVSLSETIRVNAAHLDNLLNLVSEMVVNRTRLETLVSSEQFGSLTDAIDELGQITSGLQEEILAMRMIPVSYVFNRFPRMVRDVAHQLRKEVELVIEGQDIDLDRMVLDEISEPLTHLLRNAIDHGIEPPEIRVASGKPRTGTVKLSAARKHGSVVIEVADDGRGIDPEKIKKIALEKGLADPEEIASMGNDDCYSLMWKPGFTTVGKATAISGRGVGLDAVKDKISDLGGILRIRSMLGSGSSFGLEVPLTLALIPALMVTVRKQIFALPLSNVIDIASSHDVETHRIGDRQVIVFRGETIPLVDQRAIFGGPDPDRKPGYVVTVQVGDDRVGLKVERVIRKQEIVLKPLTCFLRGIKSLAGSTVLGDGTVALVVDPRNLLECERKLRGAYV